MSARTRVLILLSLAELLAMALWFSGTAVAPQLARAGLSLTAWLTISVQLGFVAGALLIAIFNLSDVFSAPRIFVISAVLAAAGNVAFAMLVETNETAALFCRFLTGAFLAGVYPTGMKILAGWFREGRGFALGVLIGALTVGSASPHLLLYIGSFIGLTNVLAICLAASGSAVVAGFIVALFVHDGPYAAPSPRFDPRQIAQLVRNRRLLLTNLGYLGHMWELYSLWGFIAAIFAASASGGMRNEALAFAVIAIGAVGCIWAGRLSDQWGERNGARSPSTGRASGQTPARARVTIVALAVSGSCCLLAAIFFHNFWILVPIALVWGVAVVADSAQFSALVSELADQRYVGTALTTQVAAGFLLTTISLRVTAYIAAHWGWPWAIASLAVGPVCGIAAMAGLIQQPPTKTMSS